MIASKTMTKQELKEKLLDLANNHPMSYFRKLKLDKELYEAFLKYIPAKIDCQQYNVATKAYWILNDLLDFPKCINCGKELAGKNVRNIFAGYRPCCSQKCAKQSSQRKEKYKEACLKRFGCENASQSTQIKKKKEDTCLKNFGVDNPAKSSKIKDKMKQTTMKRYGVEYALQNKDILDKSYKTMKERYGVEHPMQNKLFQDKAIETSLKHFNVKYPMQSHEVRVKAQSKYKYNNINFDSAPELFLYVFLRDNNIKFEYQPNVQFQYEFNGKQYQYNPDFLIDGKLVEVKGRHFFKEDGTMQNPWDHSLDALYEAKHQCMLRNSIQIMLDDDELIVFAKSYVESTYRKEFSLSCKQTSKYPFNP